MLAWLGTWVGTEAAEPFSALMIQKLWYQASKNTATGWGPLASAYGLIRPALRQHMERKGSYLPINALKFVARPTSQEIMQLCLAHVLIGECCVLEGLDEGERTSLGTAIYVKYACVPERHLNADAIIAGVLQEDIVKRLRLQLDMREIGDRPHLGWLSPAYNHEVDRSKRWISSIASGERSY